MTTPKNPKKSIGVKRKVVQKPQGRKKVSKGAKPIAVKKKKGSGLFIEVWNRKKTYVIRDKGRIVTHIGVTKSKLKPEQAKKKFKETGSFIQNVQLSDKLNKKLKYVRYNLDTKIKGKKLSTQIGVKVTWSKDGKTIGVTYGHSKKNGTKEQAFSHARTKAINNYGYFLYDESGITFEEEYFNESFLSV